MLVFNNSITKGFLILAQLPVKMYPTWKIKKKLFATQYNFFFVVCPPIKSCKAVVCQTKINTVVFSNQEI